MLDYRTAQQIGRELEREQVTCDASFAKPGDRSVVAREFGPQSRWLGAMHGPMLAARVRDKVVKVMMGPVDSKDEWSGAIWMH